ncbi:MAG: DUF4956 domain-containing protein [Gammaproteobacteria bacterium]|nr:DUF4956 domain-containing protein [Gammaproteobacteria bacterium]
MEQRLESLIKALTGFGSQQMEDVGIAGFIFVISVSLVGSIFIAYLYRYFYAGRSTGSQIHRAFPLLAISITSIFLTIQFSLPLSLGLLGALSIVRFRTPIKEPEEIGFLMLVIATAISCATFNFVLLSIVLFVAVVGLFLLKSGIIHRPQDEGMIIVTLPLDQHRSLYDKVIGQLNKHTQKGRVESISKTETDSVISYAFRGLGGSSLTELQAGLDEILASSSYNIFLNQQRVS